MNYKLTSAILKSVWAIEPRAAIANGTLLSIILNHQQNELQIEESPKISAVSKNGYKYDNLESAPSGSAAIIPIVGELMKYDQLCGPVGTKTIGKWIVEADQHPKINAIVLNIDSPGGTVDGTETLENIIKATKKPIVAFIDGMMCSAALWVGSAADIIIASTPHDEIGSIGVMVSFADVQPYYEKMGIKFHTIRAEQSKEKNEVFYQALAGNYDKIKKEMLNPLADAFIETIRTNRPGTTKEQYTGKVFFAKDVLGSLVDGIGNLDYAVNYALSLIENEFKKIVRYDGEKKIVHYSLIN
jgi:protease IV